MLMFITLFFLSLILTYGIRNYALKKELLDHPNTRSSHTVPTPKGGGLAIIFTFYAAVSYLFIQTQIDDKLFFALLSALPVVFISLVDDIRPLSAKVRFSIQLISGVFALYFLGGIDTLNFALFNLQGSWLNLFALFGIIWLTNLYNFLDGIDGYAASEALIVGVGAYVLFGSETALILAVATAGFLLFNWHKASIFMGDVGSAPLGFIFAILTLYDASSSNFLGWLMLLSLFWFDATFTLLRRAKKKESLSQAHKKHAYQRLVQAGIPHDKVVLLAMGINLFILVTLYYTPQSSYLYLFFVLLVVLYSLTKYIDTKKAFE